MFRGQIKHALEDQAPHDQGQEPDEKQYVTAKLQEVTYRFKRRKLVEQSFHNRRLGRRVILALGMLCDQACRLFFENLVYASCTTRNQGMQQHRRDRDT
jgi:hypothetical protein